MTSGKYAHSKIVQISLLVMSLQRLVILYTVLFALLITPVKAQEMDELLAPEQAYQLTLTTPSTDLIVAQWTIAEGYYLYRSRFQFTSLTPAIDLGKPRFPTGKIKEDEFFVLL